MTKNELVNHLESKGFNPSYIWTVPYTEIVVEVYDTDDNLIWKGEIIDYDEDGNEIYEETEEY